MPQPANDLGIVRLAVLPAALAVCAATFAVTQDAFVQQASRATLGVAQASEVLSLPPTPAPRGVMSDQAFRAAGRRNDLKQPFTSELSAWASRQKLEELFGVLPEIEAFLRNGELGDDANDEGIRGYVQALADGDGSLSRVSGFAVERFPANESTDARPDRASSLLTDPMTQGDREVEPTLTPRPPVDPAGKELSFRIAPTAPATNRSHLTEKEVARHRNRFTGRGSTRPGTGRDYQWFKLAGHVPAGQITHEREGTTYILLSNRPHETMLSGTGWCLTSVRLGKDRYGQPCVRVDFDEPGARKLRRLSTDNIKRNMAVLVDNTVQLVLRLMAPISHTAVMSGSFTPDEAEKLARALRAGMLTGHGCPGSRARGEPPRPTQSATEGSEPGEPTSPESSAPKGREPVPEGADSAR